MARKKEQAVMEAITDEAEYVSFVDKPGLNVIDVYQTWCGPCKPVQVLFKRLKMELGNCSFATADSSLIEPLAAYKGDCEPVFLAFGGGQEVGKMVGCNAPIIERTIKELAQIEEDVMAGKIKRQPKSDSSPQEGAEADTAETAPEEESTNQDPHEIPKIVTCLIIKPDILKEEDKVKEIMELIELNGITIVMDETKILSDDNINSIYSASSQEYKDYMKSDMVRILALTKGETGLNIIKLTSEMVGHEEPATAKKQNPKSIRALFGEDLIKNAVHLSASAKEAETELNILFPDFVPPIASVSAQQRDSMVEEAFKSKAILEQTVTLIRPSANAQHKDDIIKAATDSGYTILRSIEIKLDDNQFDKLYSRHAEADYYAALKEEMLSGPATVLELEKEDALTDWRALIGPMVDAKENAPDSLRAKFQVGDINPIHAASNQSQVKLETDLFFQTQDLKQTPAAEEQQAAPEVAAEQTPAEADAPEQAAAEEAPAEEQAAAEEAPAEEQAAVEEAPAEEQAAAEEAPAEEPAPAETAE